MEKLYKLLNKLLKLNKIQDIIKCLLQKCNIFLKLNKLDNFLLNINNFKIYFYKKNNYNSNIFLMFKLFINILLIKLIIQKNYNIQMK